MKRFVLYFLSLPSRLYNFLLLKYRGVIVGDDLKISGKLCCYAEEKGSIVIGNNVTINSSRSSNMIGGDDKMILLAKDGGRIRIGNGCGLSNSTLCAFSSIELGDNVFLGGSVKIYDTDFHWIDFNKRISYEGGVKKSVKIESGAFIGAHTIILKGVTIGERSVVGAGSVVTKDIPADEVWAGNPARFIRSLEETKNTETHMTV